ELRRCAHVGDDRDCQSEAIAGTAICNRQIAGMVAAHELYGLAPEYAYAIQLAAVQHHHLAAQIVGDGRHESAGPGEKGPLTEVQAVPIRPLVDFDLLVRAGL